jgi:hypothetical protein
LGLNAGALACTPGCVLDETGCSDCGNQIADGVEDCDGIDLDGETCLSRGYDGGPLACSPTCEWDTWNCEEPNPYSLRIDGLDDVVNCGPLGLGLPLSSLTIEFWLKPDLDADGYILQKWVEWEDSQCSMANISASFYVDFYQDALSNGIAHLDTLWGGCGGVGTSQFIEAPEAEWHHVAYVWDSTGSTVSEYEYLDGGVVDGGTTFMLSGLSVPASPYPLLLGDDECPGEHCNPFGGLVDEVRIWDYPRTASEIGAGATTELTGSEPGLVAYFPFGEGSGQYTEEMVTGTMCLFGPTTGPDPQDAAFAMDTPF